MLQVIVAQTTYTDGKEGAEALWSKAQKELGMHQRYVACLLYVGRSESAFVREIAATLLKHREDLALVGATAYAQASATDGGYAVSTTTAVFFASSRVPMAAVGGGALPHAEDDARREAQALLQEASAALPIEQVSLGIVFSEMQLLSLDAIFATLQEQTRQGALFVGGASGFPEEITLDAQASQICGEQVFQGGLAMLLFGDPLECESFFSNAGWMPLVDEHWTAETRLKPGDPTRRLITKLNGEAALPFYRRFLGMDDLPKELGAQLSICTPLIGTRDNGEHVYIDVLDHVEDQQALEVTADVGEAPDLGIAIPHVDVMKRDIGGAAADASARLAGRVPHPSAVLYFSCCSRPIALRAAHQDARMEYRLLQEGAREAPIAGFYGYLEFGPRGPGRLTRPESMSLVGVVLGETPSDTPHVEIARTLMSRHGLRQKSDANKPLVITRPQRAGAIKARHLRTAIASLLNWAQGNCRLEAHQRDWCIQADGSLDLRRLSRELTMDDGVFIREASMGNHLRSCYEAAMESDLSSAEPVYLEALVLGRLLALLETNKGMPANEGQLDLNALSADIAHFVRDHPVYRLQVDASHIEGFLVSDGSD